MFSISENELINIINGQNIDGVTPVFDDTEQPCLFDLITLNTEIIQQYLQAFNFFIVGETVFDPMKRSFLVFDEGNNDDYISDRHLNGYIDKENYRSLFQLILAMNYIKSDVIDITKVKSKRARKILEKIKQEKAKIKKKSDGNLSIGNIISKVASNSNINIKDIWCLTIYQLYNEFQEISHKKVIDIGSMNYAFAGGDFDLSEWIKPTE